MFESVPFVSWSQNPHVSFILHPVTKCVDRTHYGSVVPFIICFVSEIPKCVSIKSSAEILYLRMLDESRFSSCISSFAP